MGEAFFDAISARELAEPTVPLPVGEPSRVGSTDRSTALIQQSIAPERGQRGIYVEGNTPDRLQAAALYAKTDETTREVRILRGESIQDSIVGGVQMSRSFVEAPSSGLLNEIEGTPFALEDGLPEQLGPNPTTGDGFGPVVPNQASAAGDPPDPLFPIESNREGSGSPRTVLPVGDALPGIPVAESLSAEARPAEETGANPSLNEEIEGPLSSRQEQQFTTRGAEREESPSRVGGRSDLTAEEEEEVRQLRERDREVREHEAAHVAAAGGLAGNPTYTLVSGPDNRQYAVGGEVQIDTSEGSNPEETIDRAQRVQRSALAPAEPSPQDRSVAASAARMETTARVELAEQQRLESLERQDIRGGESAQSALLPGVSEPVVGGLGTESTTGGPEVFTAVQAEEQRLGSRDGIDLSESERRIDFAGPLSQTGPERELEVAEGTERLRPAVQESNDERISQGLPEGRVEATSGASSRVAAAYQSSENAFQGDSDYISVA